MRRLTASGL